jgi:preprotein translocase subunit SecG
MTTIVLVIHLLIALALVGIILLQRSEGGGTGLGGGGGGSFGGLMSTRGQANLLTRTTAVLAAAFVATSLILAILGSRERAGGSILDRVAPPASAPAGSAPGVDTAPAEPPAEPAPAVPAAPAAPVAQ